MKTGFQDSGHGWKIIPTDWTRCGGHFDVDAREDELRELNARIEDPTLWDRPEEAQKLMQDKTRIERTLRTFHDSTEALDDALTLFEMGAEEGDADTQMEAVETLDRVQAELEALELARMLGGETDAESAFLDINAGSGGTEIGRAHV